VAFIPLDAAAEINDDGGKVQGSCVADFIPDESDVTGRDSMEQADRVTRLRAAVECLPAKEKTILTMYYFEGIKLEAIGRFFKQTESRMCQVRQMAVDRLRATLCRGPDALAS
jgi:RNA polymerase sigma factor for flagellar operon FliA